MQLDKEKEKEAFSAGCVGKEKEKEACPKMKRKKRNDKNLPFLSFSFFPLFPLSFCGTLSFKMRPATVPVAPDDISTSDALLVGCGA